MERKSERDDQKGEAGRFCIECGRKMGELVFISDEEWEKFVEKRKEERNRHALA